MALYIAPTQNVNLNESMTFDASISCPSGDIFHEDGTGNFYLRGNTCNRFARYKIICQGNIAVPTGGAVTPIAIGITSGGSLRQNSRSIVTPAAVDQYGNFTATDTITVPRGMSIEVSANYVSGVTDGTTTPTPALNIINGSIEINRIA